jgi:uncharacterized RDD family membrane protein YckC
MIVEPAPVWKRLLAWVYDGLILTALWLVSGLVAALLAGGEAPPWLVRTIVLVSSVAYFGWSWQPLTWSDTALRMVVSLACLAPIGVMLFTAWVLPHRQTIYDRLSQTQVVLEPKSTPQ